MFRLTTLLAVATLSTGSAVFAGDTVTVNVPGGATQGILTIRLASHFAQGVVTAGGGQPPVPLQGGYVTTSANFSEITFTISSPFVSALLYGYASPQVLRAEPLVGAGDRLDKVLGPATIIFRK